MKDIRSMRLFLAVMPGKEARKKLVTQQEEMRSLGYTGNYTARDNLHITMIFLGDATPDRIVDIDHAMNMACNMESFDASLGEIGFFERSGIIWTGVESPGLVLLHNRLSSAISSYGWPGEPKNFSPHITLLRKPNITVMPNIKTSPCPWLCDELVLMQSTRIGGELKYIPVSRCPISD